MGDCVEGVHSGAEEGGRCDDGEDPVDAPELAGRVDDLRCQSVGSLTRRFGVDEAQATGA